MAKSKPKKGRAFNPTGIQGTPTESEWKKIRKFGKIIRKERMARGWTLEYMEERGWKSWQHWQAIEAGKKNITFASILRICASLRVKLEKIWGQM